MSADSSTTPSPEAIARAEAALIRAHDAVVGSRQGAPNVVPMISKITTTVQEIDPDTARRWLGQNTQNRPKKRVKIQQYARDMAAGRWQLNGEAIKFDRDGVLRDGQNRLYAVVESGATIVSLVIRGLAPEAQQSMDGGASRTAADNFAIDGVKHSTTLASGIRSALTVRDAGYASLGRYAVSKGEVAEFFHEHPEMEMCAGVATKVARQIDCPPGLIAFALWRLMQISAQEALDFFTDAAERVNLPAGDPVLALGKRFAEARRNRENLTHEMRISMVYRAWNARRAGRTLTVLKVNSSKGGIIDVPEPR